MSIQSGPQFSTPSEFLEYVRSAYATRETRGVSDDEMARLTREGFDALGLSRPDPENPYEPLVREMGDRVITSLRSRFDSDVSGSCAIGALESQSVNARCFRGEEGHYAIVMHHGLMNILHKRSKLLTAAVDPSRVIYCNRKEPAKLTSQDLALWAEELGEIYRVTGVTKGAMVKLDQEASVAAAAILTLSETFVLGHEVGHIIAGHLEDDSRLIPDDRIPWLEFFPESAQHQDEFEADEYGFAAMCDTYDSVSKTTLLGGMVSTFATFGLIGAGAASDTHPSAMDRIHRLSERHFSAETARLVRLWVDDGDQDAGVKALETAC